jgi:subtilase family serine protease
MLKNTLAAFALAQLSGLEQEAHRPYLRKSGTDSKTPSGYTPQQMRHAYGIDQIANQGAGQIIGIVDGFDYPSVESDLGVFTSQFGLPACTQANGCLTVIYATGTKPPPNAGWSGETSLDVQWAHAIAPQAQIKTLLEAVPVAVAHGAAVINMSWVVGAGGTTLDLDSSGNKRGVPDVVYDSNPNTGVPVYDSEDGNWAEVGGASASSPRWSAITAIANSIRASMGKGAIGGNFLNVVYANPLAFNDITQGSNGTCGPVCTAGPGYDFVTGLGSPMALQVVDAPTVAP